MSPYFGLLAAVSVATMGAVTADATRSYAAIPMIAAAQGPADVAATAQKCRVDVMRSGVAGAASVARSVLPNGDCVCTVSTGAAAANGSAEDVVSALLRDRECTGAPPAAQGIEPAASAAGGMNAALPIALGTLVAGGLAAGLGGSSNG